MNDSNRRLAFWFAALGAGLVAEKIRPGDGIPVFVVALVLAYEAYRRTSK